MESYYEIVDLNEYPQQTKIQDENTLVTFGDLHGNAVKFMHFLINEGMVTLPERDYHELVAIYEKRNALDAADLEKFNQILSHMQASDSHAKLLLIGDDLADRGENDYFILKMYERLDELNIDCEVLASNHGFEFLRQYAHGLENENITLYSTEDNKQFGTSLAGLQQLINSGLVKLEDVNKLIEEHYLNKLHLIKHETFGDIELLYSHAPVTPGKINRIAASLGVLYNFGEPFNTHLDEKLKKINEKFREHVTKNGIAKLDTESMNFFLNDRYQNVNLSDQNFDPSHPVSNIHGHVGEEIFVADIPGWEFINLDSDLGKGRRHNQGNYITHVKTTQQQPAEKPKPLTDYTAAGLFKPKKKSSRRKKQSKETPSATRKTIG